MKDSELDNIFIYYSPTQNQVVRYQLLRDKAKELAKLINSSCPESREKSLAFTQLQSTIHWANSSIALHEVTIPPVPDVTFDTTDFG